MVGRGELTDTAWSVIEPLLSANQQRGGQWCDHRMVGNVYYEASCVTVK